MENLTETDRAAIEAAVVAHDFQQLSPDLREAHYRAVCESVGLNPLTNPLEYLWVKSKKGDQEVWRLILYARKDCTDQLRKIHKVSVKITSRNRDGDVYCVTALAAQPDGRTDESMGVVSVKGLGGDWLANALMKAETKAKRRVTLSICGLGMLDETEVETIPEAAIQARGEEAKPPVVPVSEEKPAQPIRRAAATAPAAATTAPSSQGAAQPVEDRVEGWRRWLTSPSRTLADFEKERERFFREFGGAEMPLNLQSLWRGAVAARCLAILQEPSSDVDEVEGAAKRLFGARAPKAVVEAVAQARQELRRKAHEAVPEEATWAPHDEAVDGDPDEAEARDREEQQLLDYHLRHIGSAETIEGTKERAAAARQALDPKNHGYINSAESNWLDMLQRHGSRAPAVAQEVARVAHTPQTARGTAAVLKLANQPPAVLPPPPPPPLHRSASVRGGR